MLTISSLLALHPPFCDRRDAGCDFRTRDIRLELVHVQSASMKFYRHWQPLVNEDARTALTFGFLRHAPTNTALDPWLTKALHRNVSAAALDPEDFWPVYTSRIEGQSFTEPELVFTADDGSPLTVILEAKPGYGQHREEQLVREVVDTASARGSARVALIAIGADIGVPESLASWNAAAVAALRDHGMPKVAVEIRYASWASLGDVIARAARVVPALTRYAEDVLAQLRLDGLLGYQGAPMLDDLDEMNLENAFVAYNRAVVAMRQFFITLHGQDTFHQTGLRALVPHRMARDGTSAALTQHEDWFQVSTFASTYRGPNFPQDVGAYVAFYFHPGDHPEMHVGAFASTALTAFHNNYAWTDESTDVEHACLSALRGADFRNAAGGRELEVVYDTWPWRPGSGDADLQWALSRLRLVVDAFTGR